MKKEVEGNEGKDFYYKDSGKNGGKNLTNLSNSRA